MPGLRGLRLSAVGGLFVLCVRWLSVYKVLLWAMRFVRGSSF